jgi:hypothetical protein
MFASLVRNMCNIVPRKLTCSAEWNVWLVPGLRGMDTTALSLSTAGKSHLNLPGFHISVSTSWIWPQPFYQLNIHGHTINVLQNKPLLRTAHTLQTVSQWNVLSWHSMQLPAYKINYTHINSNTEQKGCTIINHKITIFACKRQHISVCFLTPCVCLYIAHCMVQ